MTIEDVECDGNGVVINIEEYWDMNRILVTNSGIISAVIKADCEEIERPSPTNVPTHTYSTVMGSRMTPIYDVVAKSAVRAFSPYKPALVMIGVKSMDKDSILPHLKSIKERAGAMKKQ